MKLYEKLIKPNEKRYVKILWVNGIISDSWYLDTDQGIPVVRRDNVVAYPMDEFKRLVDWGNELFSEVQDGQTQP